MTLPADSSAPLNMPAITKPMLTPTESKEMDINIVMAVPLSPRPAKRYASSMVLKCGGVNAPWAENHNTAAYAVAAFCFLRHNASKRWLDFKAQWLGQ